MRIAILITCFFLLPFISHTAYLHDVPVTVRQPDGTTLHCFATGDEFHSWLHDRNGFTIIQDRTSGFYVYAERRGELLVPTAELPGRDDPAGAGLLPHANISLQAEEAIRALAPEYATPGHAANPRSGVFSNLVIFVRFSDDDEFGDPFAQYVAKFNEATPGVSSVYNYIREISFGRLEVMTSFFPTQPGSTVLSYLDVRPRAYYYPYSASDTIGYPPSQRYIRERELTDRAISAIAGQIPNGLVLDGDGDGYVDNVCFIIQGDPVARGTFLWPHMSSMRDMGPMIGTKKVNLFNVQMQSRATVAVFVHEMLHSLGAPDTYRYTTSDNVVPVGRWDLMADTREIPQHTGAWLRYKYLGWIDTIPRITTSGRYSLRPLTSPSNNCYRIDSPVEGECFILEYRKRTSIFESILPGEGLLVYRIDSLLRGNADGPPDEVYLYRPGGNPYLGFQLNGTLDSAAFCRPARTAISGMTNPACILASGLMGNLDLSEIGFPGDSITFTVNMKPAPPAWERVASPTPGAINAVTFTSPASGWLAGESGLLRSTDAGLTWAAVSSQSNKPSYGVSAVDPLRCWVIDSAAINRTSDGGVSWEPSLVSVPEGGRLCVIQMLSATRGWVVGTGGVLYTTTNGGIHWTLVPLSTTRTLRGVYFADPSRGWAMGDHGTLAATQDSGATWTVWTFTDTLTMQSMTFADSLTGYLVGDFGRIYRTTNGGEVWILQQGVPTRSSLNAVAFSGRDSGWVAGARGTILRTTDGGATWGYMVSGTTQDLHTIAVVNGQTQLIAGNAGTLLKSPGSSVTAVRERRADPVGGFMLAQNFPNPFNPTTTIRFALPARMRVKLTVFNVLGQQVAVLQDGEQDAGDHSVQFDAGGFSSGVYFYRLQGGNFTETRRLLVLR